MIPHAEDDSAEVVEALLNHYREHLTEWEEGFALSLQKQISRAQFLTGPQRDKLDEIFERFSSGKVRTSKGYLRPKA